MKGSVKKTVKKCLTLVSLRANEHVLDITSNDATMLNFYPKNKIPRNTRCQSTGLKFKICCGKVS